MNEKTNASTETKIYLTSLGQNRAITFYHEILSQTAASCLFKKASTICSVKCNFSAYLFGISLCCHENG